MADYSNEGKEVSIDFPSTSSQRSENKEADYVLLSATDNTQVSDMSSEDMTEHNLDGKKDPNDGEIGGKLQYVEQKSNQSDQDVLPLSSDFSLMSKDLNSLSKFNSDKIIPSNEQSRTDLPDSFIVLDRSSSEESAKSLSASFMPHIGPNLSQDSDVLDHSSSNETDSNKAKSGVSNDSIVVLNSTDFRDSCSSNSINIGSSESNLRSNDIDGRNFFILQEEVESNNEKINIPANVVDSDEDISFPTDNALDSLLAEQYKPGKTPSYVKGHKTIIDNINADLLMAEFSGNTESTEKNDLLEEKHQIGENHFNEEMELQLQKLPDIEHDEPTYSTDVDSNPPIRVFPPSKVDQNGVSYKAAVQQMHTPDPNLGAHGDNSLCNSKAEWPDDFELHEKESILNMFHKTKSISSENSGPSDMGKSADDFSFLESDAIIPGHSDSMVVHLSEPASALRLPDVCLSQDKVQNTSSKLQTEFKGRKHHNTYMPEDEEFSLGHLHKKQKFNNTFSHDSSFDTTGQIQQRNILHNRLVQTFNQFKKQNYKLRNRSDVDKMISEILKNVMDPSEGEDLESLRMERDTSYHFVNADSVGGESTIGMIKKKVHLSEMQVRLLKMLRGEGIFKEKYGVQIQIDPHSVEILGIDADVGVAEEAFKGTKGNDEWLEDFITGQGYAAGAVCALCGVLVIALSVPAIVQNFTLKAREQDLSEKFNL